MLSFRPQSPPPTTDGTLGAWLALQFQNIQRAATTAVEALYLKTQTNTPAKTNDGDLRLADGTNWNPRFGDKRLYWYDSTTGEWKGLHHTGSGGTKTQTSNKTNSVTLDKGTGEITMNNAALAAGAVATFTFNNAMLQAKDLLIVNHVSGGTAGAYLVSPRVTAAGTASISVTNISAGSLSEAIVLRFTRIPGATS